MRSRAVHIFALVLVLAAAAWWLLHDSGGENGGLLERTEQSGEQADARTEAPTLHGVARTATPDAPGEEEVEQGVTRRFVGRVVDVARAPVRGVMVWIGATSESPFPLDFTDEDGMFRVEARPAYPAGTHLLGARHHDGRCAYARIAVPEGPFDLDLGELVIQEGETIRGTVVDEKGEPLEHMCVRAQAEQGLTLQMFRAGHRRMIGTADLLTNAKGEFVMKGLAPVDHLVYVELAFRHDVAVTPERVQGARPGDPPLKFTTRKTRVVTGRVVDAATGDPIQEFKVNGVDHEDAEGSFEVGAGTPGNLIVAALGYEAWTAPMGERSELTVELVPLSDPGSLRIIVQDGAGGGIAGWKAVLTGHDWLVWTVASKGRSEVVVEGLRDSAYQVQVLAPGWSLHRGIATVEPHRQARLTATLHRGGVVHLDVLDEDGEGVFGAVLRLLDLEGKDVAARWRYDEPQGTLLSVTELTLTDRTHMTRLLGRIDGLRAGRYVLRIHRAVGHRDVAIDVPVEGEVEQKVRLGEK